MIPSIARKTAWTALTGATLFLGACITSNEESPVIDPKFANAKIDARVAGASLVGSFEQGKDWNSAFTAPAGMTPLGVSTSVGALKKSAALPKRADAGIEFKVNLDDTAKGYATVYAEYELLFVNIIDTAVVVWDAKAKDTIKDNENVIRFKRIQTSLNGKVETAEFTDGDGDKIVTAVPGKADNKAKLVLTVDDNGVVEKTTLLVGAGPDADFNAETDNTVLEAAWVKTKGGVVTGTGAFLDADKDGVVTDNLKDCIVLAKYTEIEPKDRPLIAKVDFEAKIRVFANKAGDEPVSFSYKETTRSGRTNVATIKNRAGGTEIVKGDTMTVRLETTLSLADDTLKHAVIEFVMNPGQDLKSDADDVCYAIHIATEKRFGLERSAEFHFISDEPIPHGREPISGSFNGSATYANGKTASLNGSFSPDGFTAEFKGPEGNTVAVTYSKSGNVLTP